MYQHISYPVRTVSRSVARRTVRRASWFAMGVGFGVGCALCLTTSMTSLSPLSWSVAHEAPNLSFSLIKDIEQSDSAATEESGIHVRALALPAKPEKAAAAQATDKRQIIAAPAVAEPTAAADAAEQMAQDDAEYPLNVDMKVGKGDTLMNILTDTGVSYQEAQNVVDSIGKVYNPKKLDAGQSVSLVLDKGENAQEVIISSLSLPVSATDSVTVTRQDQGSYLAKTIKAETVTRPARAGGRIDSSLYETAVSSGLPPRLLGDLINAYSYDVDFQRDVHPGDKVEVLFERVQTKEGANAGHGNVLFAQLELGGKMLKVFRYVDKAGNADYYNEKGESVRKAMLRTPINGARITSSFGMRSHPILGYSKMHRGVDFGAPTGTPIYAAGDGVVSFVGKKGGYGNYVMIKHDGKYSSAYAHVSRFASSLSAGKKVKQGQIIAYVGTSGMSTGPHLHYEILLGGTQVNPAGVKFKTGNVLAGHELAAFKKNMAQLQAQLEATPRMKTDVAMAQ